MFKRLLCGVLAILSLVVAPVGVSANDDLVKMAQEAGYPATADIAPKGAIVIEVDTGQIIWGHDMDLQRDPASTTKTMVIYLTMKAIKEGKIAMTTEVVATPTDQAIASIFELSNNKIVAGVTYTVEELLTMTLVPSSNVTTLMLAHLIHDGDDASFIELMNATAQELGMSNTIFYNGTGANIGAFQGYYAPVGYDLERYNLTTVEDLAILARALITQHPEILEFTNDAVVTVKEGTPYQETFETYNHSLSGAKLAFEGVDGLKTGSSPTAGYNAIVTAKQGDRRLIAVVMGASQWGDENGEYVRHYFVNALFNQAFTHYERRTVLAPGNHTIGGKTYKLTQPLMATLPKGVPTPEVSVVDGQAVLTDVTALTGHIGVPVEEVVGLTNVVTTSFVPSEEDNELDALLKVVIMILLLMIAVIAWLIVVDQQKKRRD